MTRHWSGEPLCAQVGGDQWFPDEEWGSSPSRIKRICAKCPIQLECLEFALENHEVYGIWGGMTYKERLSFARERVA